MRQRILTPILLLFSCGVIDAQRTAFDSRFTIFRATTLAAAAEKLTVQQPATGIKNVYFVSASVYCSVACTATMSRDGTAASTTTLTPVAISGIGTATTATGYRSSNVGSGTAISVDHVIAAGSTVVFDLAGVQLRGNGTTKNFSVETNAITGDTKIQIIWREE